MFLRVFCAKCVGRPAQHARDFDSAPRQPEFLRVPDGLLRVAGMKAQGRFHKSPPLRKLYLVSKGLGCTLARESFRPVKHTDIVFRPIKGNLLTVETGIAYSSKRQPAFLQAYLAAIKGPPRTAIRDIHRHELAPWPVPVDELNGPPHPCSFVRILESH
jgi:hypothetical protein